MGTVKERTEQGTVRPDFICKHGDARKAAHTGHDQFTAGLPSAVPARRLSRVGMRVVIAALADGEADRRGGAATGLMRRMGPEGLAHQRLHRPGVSPTAAVA
ncbi:hypothetical protein Pth03_38690 [Planotetraspora thailandica]|uniref:Uncharacterized protein n=1 Tax=Planotetraspora thailandica TaxID=487172 RepID=A0A8J3V3I9_9ACTN|nr:hypothetical protein Pth03_38690 [Planotetraspora thailandica]